jgi:hypothetical protein
VEVDGQAIELVRESWLVEDRWWTTQPLRRRYWEGVTTSGRNVVVFHDLTTVARARGGRGARGARAHGPEDRVPTHPNGMGARWVGPEDRAPEGRVFTHRSAPCAPPIPSGWVPAGCTTSGGWFLQGP